MFMIDHINNKGNLERMSFNNGYNGGTIPYYNHILEEIKRGSKEYQLLCFICNKHKNKLDINNWCKENNKPFLELQKLRQSKNKILYEKFRMYKNMNYFYNTLDLIGKGVVCGEKETSGLYFHHI